MQPQYFQQPAISFSKWTSTGICRVRSVWQYLHNIAREGFLCRREHRTGAERPRDGWRIRVSVQQHSGEQPFRQCHALRVDLLRLLLPVRIQVTIGEAKRGTCHGTLITRPSEAGFERVKCVRHPMCPSIFFFSKGLDRSFTAIQVGHDPMQEALGASLFALCPIGPPNALSLRPRGRLRWRW